jgi:16S rRNA (adenine1518-N6/adenine1519-N6)-dimethyltransferase
MNPSEIKKVLNELGGGANKRLGQHFLIDQAALAAIVEQAPVHPGAIVLEIGPGLGVLTKALLAKGCDVVAIERDGRFVEYLNSSTTPPLDSRGGARGGVIIVRGDAAELDWMTVVGDREWSLVSNLPYSISSFALRMALWSPRPAEKVVVLVQREVAERAIAKDGKHSLLSLMVAFASSSSRIVRRVPPGAFFPPPKVESAVLEIESMPLPERVEKWGMDPQRMMDIAKKGFAHPRKFLSSNLEISQGVLASVQIAPKARAENLSPEDWARLAKALK